MPWPWTRSFSAPSDLGLPKRGMDLQLIHMRELNELMIEEFWIRFIPDEQTKRRYLEKLIDKIQKIQKEKSK
jgi:hypothetical protein